MTNWAAGGEVVTALGTVVLAVATFRSVRSADRAARSAERSLLQGMRPVLVTSRWGDATEKVYWLGDEHGIKLPGGTAHAAVDNGVVYLAVSLRNVGPGLAIMQGWRPLPERLRSEDPLPAELFRQHTRDLYIAPGDVGFWQGALRDASEPDFGPMADAVKNRQPFGIEILYSDHDGGQRMITRLSIAPREKGDDWFPATVRHWNLDRPDPR